MYKKHNITYKSVGYGRVAGYTGHGRYAYGGIFICFRGLCFIIYNSGTLLYISDPLYF